MKRLLFLGGILFLFWSCDKGEALPNQAPETTLFLDEISLAGENRLNSIVRLHWLGEDVDGYVSGYEFSFDEQSWSYTTQTDSLFQLFIPLGSDSVDVNFWVRAIDNKGLADPDPASLVVPIKNTPPVARFDTTTVIPSEVLGAWSVLWNVDDFDGIETVDSIFVRMNDGPWYGLSPLIDFISLIPANPTVAGEQAAQLFTGAVPVLQEELLQGLRVGELNQMFLRAQDISGSISIPDSSVQFFVRQQSSDLLVINAHSDTINTAVPDFYTQVLSSVYPAYDQVDLVRQLPPFWEPTFGMMLRQYDKIFWYGDDGIVEDQLLLEVVSSPLQEYLNDGGKLFVTTKFPSTFINDPATANQTPIFGAGFSPIDSLSTASGQARIRKDSLARPTASFETDYPALLASNNVVSVDPFYAKDPLQDIYTINLITVGGWTGPSTICARTAFDNGETNQVFFSVELYNFAGDMSAMEQLFSQILLEEFDW